MGGNALKNTNCVRANKSLYTDIKNTILSKLLLHHEFVPIIEMPEKETFGDLDLMYKCKNNMNIRKLVNALFSPKETVSNGDVFSFSYEISPTDYFQIDLIKVTDIHIAQFYYGYGVVGTTLGLILKKNNLTFGFDGLWVNYASYKIVLSENPREICDYCNLDYDQWISGFNTYNEIFNWIITCKYFDKTFFTIENFNHRYKTMYEKKTVFRQFIDFLENTETHNTPTIKPTVLEHIVVFNKQTEKETIERKIYLNKLHHDKFSGRVFLQYIDAKDINKCKEEFKKYIHDTIQEDFDEYLCKTDIETIHNQIKCFFLSNVTP